MISWLIWHIVCPDILQILLRVHLNYEAEPMQWFKSLDFLKEGVFINSYHKTSGLSFYGLNYQQVILNLADEKEMLHL